MITRRSVLRAGGIALLVARRPSHGQPPSKAPRIGVLRFASIGDPMVPPLRSAFRQRLANPADLPVERPTKFKRVVNRKTVAAIRLTIPHSVLMLADEVVH